MGRTKKSVDAGETATKALDAKSKAIEKAKGRIGREKASKSYREASDSELSEHEEVEKFNDPKDKDFSEEELSAASEESWNGESSGSEYGKKKKKSPVKAVAKGKGRGRGAKKAASPKKGARGRGRPPAAAAKNGSKKTPTKRARDASDDESEASEAGSSGSEYGKKKIVSPKKRAPPAKASPRSSKKATSASSSEPRSRGRRQASVKSYKEVSEDEVDEVSEDEKKPVSKRAKLDTKPKEKAKKESESKKSKKDSEDEDEEEDHSMDDEEKDEEEVEVKKNGNGTQKKKQDKKDSEEEVDDDKDSKKSDSEEEDAEEEEKPEKKRAEKEATPASENDEDDEVVDGKPTPELKNRTDTDYAKLNFDCDKKSSKGDAWNFKISCWNIGGVKAWLKKNGLEYIKRENPDVMCFVEVKCNEKTKPEEISKVEGYPHTYWSYNAEHSGQHGVAILSKTEAKNVQYGFPVEDSDSNDTKKSKEEFSQDGRLITLEFEDFYLINAYVPNSGRPEKTDEYPKGYPPKVANGERQKFDKLFINLVKDLEKKKPVIVTGDLNVAHQEIDLANPKTNERTAGFTKEERDGFTQLLEETTLIDSFRALYPDEKNAYTFWSYMNSARSKNIGWRLDYFLISEKLRDSLVENVMRSEVYGSDHCPITLFIKN